MEHVLAGFDQEKYFRLLEEGQHERAREIVRLWLATEDQMEEAG